MTVDDKDIRLCKYVILRDEGEENPKVSKFSYRYRKIFFVLEKSCGEKTVCKRHDTNGKEHKI